MQRKYHNPAVSNYSGVWFECGGRLGPRPRHRQISAIDKLRTFNWKPFLYMAFAWRWTCHGLRWPSGAILPPLHSKSTGFCIMSILVHIYAAVELISMMFIWLWKLNDSNQIISDLSCSSWIYSIILGSNQTAVFWWQGLGNCIPAPIKSSGHILHTSRIKVTINPSNLPVD